MGGAGSCQDCVEWNGGSPWFGSKRKFAVRGAKNTVENDYELANPHDTGAATVEGAYEPTKHHEPGFSSSSSDSEDPLSPAGRSRGGRRARCRVKRRRRCCCFGVVVLVVALALAFLWPRDPEWTLKDVGMSTEVLDEFANAITGYSESSAPLTFFPVIDFYNTNFVGTTTGTGEMKLFFFEDSLGTGQIPPMSIGMRSVGRVKVAVSMTLNATVSAKMYDYLSAHDFELPISADVHLQSAQFGPLKVFTDIHCEVLSDSLQVPDHPDRVIKSEHCTYRHRLAF